MRLSVRHVTTYAYDLPVDRSVLRMKLYPSTFDSQRPGAWSVTVNGKDVPKLLTTGFGDKESLWACDGPLDQVEIIAAGEVETRDASGFVRGLKESARPGVYLRATPLTEADDAIAVLAKTITGANPLDKLHKLCATVREAMDYVTGATDQRTTAKEALKKGKGVCQDHAHVFISAVRAMGMPARYVVGYLLASQEKGTETLTETHAWAEAYVPDLGWVGFDAANRLCPTDQYVRLASGLDSADAAPIRGNVSGRAKENLHVSVDVSLAASQQQTQQ